MINEILLILSVFIIFGSELIFFKLFGKYGLFCFTAIATIAANIEVLIVVNAFGMEMTLGNVLFASTFLVTDIVSEIYGKKDAKKAVHIGIATSIVFMVFSQWWLLYTPAETDFAMEPMRIIFSNTTRVIVASMVTYVIVQAFDVWAYHKWWEYTTKKFGDKNKLLWLRNNGSTMISQLLNTVLFTVGAFWGTYDAKTIVNICLSTYVIYFVTSIVDTPFIYAARKIAKRG